MTPPLHILPTQLTPFVGRQQELAEIATLLNNPACRLLTLVGPGGIGKTRLALQAIAEQTEQFEHGVYFVPLATLDSPTSVVSALTDALNFSVYSSPNFDRQAWQEDPKNQLLSYLREKELLLLLDNFEHLLAGATLVGEILDHAPGVQIMVTSREPLKLAGEWRYDVRGMHVPDDMAANAD